MANDKPDTITVSRTEWEDLTGRLARLESAHLQAVGVDPAIVARASLPRLQVQFTKHYSRSAVPSKIQKDANVIEAYSVSEGDIVNLLQDEFDRLMADRPGLIEADPKKFTDKVAKQRRAAVRNGMHGYEERTVKIKVADLIKHAQDVG